MNSEEKQAEGCVKNQETRTKNQVSKEKNQEPGIWNAEYFTCILALESCIFKMGFGSTPQ